MFDLTDHQNAALASLLYKRLEYYNLFLQCEILSAPSSACGSSAISYRFALDESVALLADPASGRSEILSGLDSILLLY